MPTNYNFKKGTDLPSWHWLNFFPAGASNPGTANCWDGTRYMYWAVQFGTGTVGTASTTQLYRFDTWNNGWQFLVSLTSGNQGLDLEYDSVRNVVYALNGNALTTAQVFNVNTTAVTIANVSVPAWTLGSLPALPAGAGAASSFTMPDDTTTTGTLVSNGAVAIDTDTAATGTTTTSIVGVSNPGSFGPGMIGLYVRFTSGAQSGSRRQITAVPSPTTLTCAAFAGTPAVGDAFVVEVPEGVAAAGGSTTTVVTAENWTVNAYANNDVIMITGTLAGQRRRIASNTATTLTLAGAVTGNARTGAFTGSPAAGDIYRIVPSSDFLYYQVGGSTALYRLDVVQTTGAAWSAVLGAVPAATGGGANTFFAGQYDPFGILCVRGSGTATIYRYSIGLNTWSTLTSLWGGETITTGASAAMLHGKRHIFIQKEASQRCMAHDLTTGMLEPFALMPYAAPAGLDGHRARFVRTADGVEWMYIMRAGGQEFFRIPIEWF